MAQAIVTPHKPAADRLRSVFVWASQSHAALAVFWAVAGASWLMLIVKARAGGGDFFEIWKGIRAFDTGHSMYFQNGSTMSFLYPPSAGLLLAPFGALPFSVAQIVFAVAQATTISLACVLALQLAGRLRTWTVPLAVLAGSLALPARNSEWLGNMDGVVVALELVMLVAAARNRWMWAAVAFGFGLALKPVLLPLVVIFVLTRQSKMLVPALLIPTVLSGMAMVLGRDGIVFVTKVLPFLWAGQSSNLQNVNVSLAGAAQYFHLPASIIVALRLAAAAATVALLVAAWRRAGSSAEKGIALAEAASIVMLGVLLAFSYSWAHYILFLLPMFALYGLRGSIVRGWMAGIAYYLLLFPDDALWARLSFGLSQVRLTFGMLLLASALGLAVASEIRSRRKSSAAPPVASLPS